MMKRVDLNLATPGALAELPGIDADLADSIVAWRERTGGYATVGELVSVPGVSPRLLAELSELVSVGAVPDAARPESLQPDTPDAGLTTLWRVQVPEESATLR